MKHLLKFNEDNNSNKVYKIEITIPSSIINFMIEKEFPEYKFVEIYKEYLKHSLGTNWNADLEEFELWTENSQDDIESILEE